MNKSKSGFTIVELLIVIVVIGILAAIVIVAYNGVVERARIASGLAFEAQIKNKYGADTTGSWALDDCAGTTASNTGGSTTADAITGTATWITDTPTGKGCALRFNGSTHIETQATLGSTYYVRAAWVRISTATCSSDNIISQAATNGVQAVFWASSCKLAAGHNGAWSTVQSPQPINDNKWHYVAVIWENGVLTLYIDGNSVSTATGVSAPANSASGTVSIGAYNGGNTFIGDIDNVFVAGQ